MREEIQRLLERQPFRPFRIFVSDGTEYEIRNPQSTAVERPVLTIVYPVVATEETVIERMVRVAIIHVTRLEVVIPTEL